LSNQAFLAYGHGGKLLNVLEGLLKKFCIQSSMDDSKLCITTS